MGSPIEREREGENYSGVAKESGKKEIDLRIWDILVGIVGWWVILCACSLLFVCVGGGGRGWGWGSFATCVMTTTLWTHPASQPASPPANDASQSAYYALCPVPCALCPVPCALCPVLLGVWWSRSVTRAAAPAATNKLSHTNPPGVNAVGAIQYPLCANLNNLGHSGRVGGGKLDRDRERGRERDREREGDRRLRWCSNVLQLAD